MPPRDPYKFSTAGLSRRFETLPRAVSRSTKNPTLGVTQGGSSRDNAGARVAATHGEFRISNQYTYGEDE